MDHFGIPKVINRHVFQALHYLHNMNETFISEEDIGKRVKHTMRVNKPRPNIEYEIHLSLSNLKKTGFLASTGSSTYAIKSSLRPIKPKPESQKKLRGVQDKSKNIRKSKNTERTSRMNIEKVGELVMCANCVRNLNPEQSYGTFEPDGSVSYPQMEEHDVTPDANLNDLEIEE